MKKNKLFILALGIPVIVLLSMTIKPLQATYLGESVRLQTAPMDPRDLVYGDYVILDFEVERVNLNQLDKGLSRKFTDKGDLAEYKGKEQVLPVYLVLKEVGKLHQVDYVTEQKPESGTFIKGKLQTYSNGDGKLIVDIPIDRYYVEENTGKKLEDDARKGKIIAYLKVYKGYPILKDVEFNR